MSRLTLYQSNGSHAGYPPDGLDKKYGLLRSSVSQVWLVLWGGDIGGTYSVRDIKHYFAFIVSNDLPSLIDEFDPIWFDTPQMFLSIANDPTKALEALIEIGWVKRLKVTLPAYFIDDKLCSKQEFRRSNTLNRQKFIKNEMTTLSVQIKHIAMKCDSKEEMSSKLAELRLVVKEKFITVNEYTSDELY